jgi:hypothetical protein
MEEPTPVQDDPNKSPGKKTQPQKSTLPLTKVQMVCMRKNQDDREEKKTENAK